MIVNIIGITIHKNQPTEIVILPNDQLPGKSFPPKNTNTVNKIALEKCALVTNKATQVLQNCKIEKCSKRPTATEFIKKFETKINNPTPEQAIALEYVDLLDTIFRMYRAHPLELRTDGFNGNIIPPWTTNTDGKHVSPDEYRAMIEQRVDWYMNRDKLKIIVAIQTSKDPIKSGSEALTKALSSGLEAVLKDAGIPLMPKTQADIMAIRNTFVRKLRGLKEYDVAEDLIETGLAPQFEQLYKWSYTDKYYGEKMMTSALREVSDRVAAEERKLIAAGMPEKDIPRIIENLRWMLIKRSIRHQSETQWNPEFDNKDHQLAMKQAELFAKYSEMLNLRGDEHLGMSEENWDTALEVALENLPLAVTSGWFAIKLSAMATSLLGELVGSVAVRLGTTEAAGLITGFTRAEGVVTKLVETTSANALFRIFKGEFYEDSPTFVMDTIISLIGYGIVKVGGKAISATKVHYEGKLIDSTEILQQSSNQVTNIGARSTVNQLIKSGNYDGAAIVLKVLEEKGLLQAVAEHSAREFALREIVDAIIDTSGDTYMLNVGGCKL